jgi:hypothetical protein
MNNESIMIAYCSIYRLNCMSKICDNDDNEHIHVQVELLQVL